MRRGLLIILSVALVCGLVVTATYAGPGCGAHKAKAESGKSGCGQKSACHAGDFPTITMKVGDKAYQCWGTAEKAAKQNGSKIVFAVGEQVFDDQDKAVMALAEAAEGYVGKFTAIACVVDGKLVYCDEGAKSGWSAACKAKCEKASAGGSKANTSKGCGGKSNATKDGGSKVGKDSTGKASGEVIAIGGSSCGSKVKAGAVAKAGSKACCAKGTASKATSFFVLGREFKTYEAASKARDTAASALDKVKMTYIVDGEKVDCASKVCPKAKAAGKVQYVVNETKVNCEYSARVTLAQAQFEAAKTIAAEYEKS